MHPVIAFVFAFAIAAIVTPVLARLGSAVGIVDHPAPGPLKIHQRPVPLTGGIAVTVASFAGLILSAPAEGLVFLGVAAALVVGLADDARPMSAWPRLGLLSGAGALLVAGGVSVGWSGVWGATAVILLTLACSNGVNIIDGQDGLASGLGAIAVLGLTALGVQAEGQVTALGVSVAGALAGFLVWNHPPARVFLGNGGAYAVGTLITIMGADVVEHAGWSGLLAAGLCLGVFALELIITTIRRLRDGHLLRGDRLHTYDVMSARLGDRWRATVIFWTLGGVCALAAQLVIGAPLAATGIAAIVSTSAAAIVRMRLRARAPGGAS